MNTKQQAIEVIQSLSDDCTMEDIQYNLYVREKVERGIKTKIREKFVVSQKQTSSPLDIEGMPLNIPTDEIVKFVRESRTRKEK